MDGCDRYCTVSARLRLLECEHGVDCEDPRTPDEMSAILCLYSPLPMLSRPRNIAHGCDDGPFGHNDTHGAAFM